VKRFEVDDENSDELHQFSESLWNRLVPPQGEAPTVQGEQVCACKRM